MEENETSSPHPFSNFGAIFEHGSRVNYVIWDGLTAKHGARWSFEPINYVLNN